MCIRFNWNDERWGCQIAIQPFAGCCWFRSDRTDWYWVVASDKSTQFGW